MLYANNASRTIGFIFVARTETPGITDLQFLGGTIEVILPAAEKNLSAVWDGGDRMQVDR